VLTWSNSAGHTPSGSWPGGAAASCELAAKTPMRAQIWPRAIFVFMEIGFSGAEQRSHIQSCRSERGDKTRRLGQDEDAGRNDHQLPYA
jgi:hypothetical protein